MFYLHISLFRIQTGCILPVGSQIVRARDKLCILIPHETQNAEHSLQFIVFFALRRIYQFKLFPLFLGSRLPKQTKYFNVAQKLAQYSAEQMMQIYQHPPSLDQLDARNFA